MPGRTLLEIWARIQTKLRRNRQLLVVSRPKRGNRSSSCSVWVQPMRRNRPSEKSPRGRDFRLQTSSVIGIQLTISRGFDKTAARYPRGPLRSPPLSEGHRFWVSQSAAPAIDQTDAQTAHQTLFPEQISGMPLTD